MKVVRSMKIKTKDFCVGDQIAVKLKKFGRFTATAQSLTEDGAWFLFDDAIAITEWWTTRPLKSKMLEEKMALIVWVEECLPAMFPPKMQDCLTKVTLPSYGQIFGHDDKRFEENLQMEPDSDEQFPLMAKRKNRIIDNFKNEWGRWWLRNSIKAPKPDLLFLYANGGGSPDYTYGSVSCGVRPIFFLRKKVPH